MARITKTFFSTVAFIIVIAGIYLVGVHYFNPDLTEDEMLKKAGAYVLGFWAIHGVRYKWEQFYKWYR